MWCSRGRRRWWRGPCTDRTTPPSGTAWWRQYRTPKRLQKQDEDKISEAANVLATCISKGSFALDDNFLSSELGCSYQCYLMGERTLNKRSHYDVTAEHRPSQAHTNDAMLDTSFWQNNLCLLGLGTTISQDVQCHAICTLGKTNKSWLGFATNVFLLGLTIASNFFTIQNKFWSIFDSDDHLIFRLRETIIDPYILVQRCVPFTTAIKVNHFQLCVLKTWFYQ